MTVSLWLDPPEVLAPALDRDVDCDVVVVGAGLAGCSAALALAEAGVQVVWLERDRVAGAATGRNAGLLLQGTAERYDRATAIMGRDRARAIHRLSLENHALIRELVERHAIDCDYRKSGSLQLAGSAAEEHELLESARLLVEDGFHAEHLQGAALPELYRNAGFRVGVVLPDDGELHPVRFVRGVARAAMAAGVRLYEMTNVRSLDASTPGDVRAVTEHGTVKAQLALVCLNVYTGALLPWFQDKIDPVRGQMLATGPAPRIFDRPVYADHGFDYWRQQDDGRIALGGWRNLDPESERGFDDVLHDAIQTRMVDFLHRFDALSGVQITHRWSGIMGFSRDGLPLVGPAPGASGALVACGFTGHGFGFAALAGKAIAALALDGSHEFADLCPPRRFS
jgi:glycine/D-amino acid oxidase-like deaminating enzyme